MTTTEDLTAPDLQLRFLLPTAGVRGVAVRLDDTWQTMAARAVYPQAVGELLGEAAAAAALFTGHAKIDGRLSVQLRSHGPLRTLFAECTAAGTLRGIAQLDQEMLDDGNPPPSRDLRTLGEDTVLAITIENPSLGGRDPMRYQGLVELDADNLAEAFEGYFRQSEQLPTRLLLACDGERAAGLMLQKLPADAGDEDGWNRASALFETLDSQELLALPPADIVHRLFHEETPRLLDEKPLRFACSCSRERVAAMLVSLGTEEAHAAVDAGAGEARVRCEFCGQDYRFDASEVAGLFRDAAVELPAAPGIQ
ncbi:MAG: Hsp33 family molecular chaperone HslO [Lysobacteraceae bacterium]|nr:MAG: Hsp33 family molecular chaperone HslO [Xanthomonadaceae bacterium]